jgi:hypothetical protein
MLNVWLQQAMFVGVHLIGKEVLIALFQPIQQFPSYSMFEAHCY